MKKRFRLPECTFLPTLCLLVGMSPFFTAGQPLDEYSVFNYSVDKGLSQSTVYSIFQDSRGFIWIGTRGGGLNCFDGYTFRVFTSRHDDPATISGNEVIAIYEDRRGYLWVGNRISGLDRFDIDSEQFKHYQPGNIRSDNISVNCFLEDKNGRLWMGCDSGLYVYNHEADSFVWIEQGEKIQVSSLCEGQGGELFIGSRKGIYSYSSGLDHPVLRAGITMPGQEQGRGWNAAMITDSKNNIWYGGLNGLYLVRDSGRGEIIRNPLKIDILDNVHIRALKEDRNGYLWIGCPAGLVRVDPVTRETRVFSHNDNDPESIGHSSVYSLMEDELGNIWAGTWSGGISMLSYLPRKFQVFRHIPFSNSLSNNLVSSFAEGEGGMWIGTEAGGLNFFDQVTREFTAYRKTGTSGMLSDHIKCVLKDSENTIWAGTWGKGIFRFNDKTGKFTRFLGNLNVFTMREDRQGYLWAGTLNGLYRMERKTGKTDFFSPENASGLKDYFITSLFCDHRGNLWAGTKTGGLHLFNPETGKFLSYRKSEQDRSGLIDNYIICMNQDRDNNLWIGTNKGLCRYDYVKKCFEDHSGKAGFPDLVINGIVPDETGNLWISTNKGLTCYSPASGVLRNFDVQDGLQSNEFTRGAFFKKADGEILFGGINGFNAFHPGRIRYNQNEPRIVITGLKLFNQPVKADHSNNILERHISLTDHIRLNYQQSFIEISFVALNFLNPSKNQYKYILEGYNKDWISLGNESKITFMNLREGEYVFRVTGSNNDGIWSKKGASLRITILPPFWRTRMAYLVYILLILLSVFLLQRFMTYRIEQKNLILMERNEKERNEELNRAKLQFFTNITHELRTPLSLISGPVDMLMLDKTAPEERTFYYRIIRSNITRLKRLVDQVIEFRKAENEKLALRIQPGNLHLFLHSLYENFVDYANRKEIDFQFRSDIPEGDVHWFDPDFLDKIIFNLLSNAFKFTPAGGVITMEASIAENMASISVRDTGKGIDPDILPGLFERLYSFRNPRGIAGSGIGLYLSKRLAETHKGTIHAVSEPDKGSEFSIRFPVNRASYSGEEFHPADKGENSAGKDGPAEYTGTEVGTTGVPWEDNQSDDRRTILVVDDNHEMVASLGLFLSKKFHIRTAYNGREAIHIAREKLPDLIIADLKMPEMDGLELCDKVKSDALINHIPVVIMTARTGLENQIEGLSKGADAYVEKPFDFVYLETVAGNLISQRDNLRKRFALENTGFHADLSDNPAEKFMAKAFEKVTLNMADPLFSVEELCSELNMSRSQLFRKFRALTGMSPSDYIRITRLRKAALLLLKENTPVSQVAEEVGFTSHSHFISAFKKLFGTTPKQYISSKKGFNHP